VVIVPFGGQALMYLYAAYKVIASPPYFVLRICVAITCALGAVCLVHLLRRCPHIILDRGVVRLGPLRLRWRHIKDSQILVAPGALPMLQITTARRTVTRAIAPEISLDDVRQRLAEWSGKPQSAPGVTSPAASASGVTSP
jgi:hypothetical protein